MKIAIESFKGIVPLADSRLLAPEIATLAINCRFETGDLEPYKDLLASASSIKANTKSLFLYNDIHWLSWDRNVDVILSPVIDDAYDTVIWTGDLGYPRIGYNTTVTGNATPPNVSYRLGVQAPITAPTIGTIANNTQDALDIQNDETRFYVYTYVSEIGEEGAPSPVSTEVTILNPNTATVELILPAFNSNGYNITQIRIYRSGTTLSTSDFFLVATIPIGSTTFTDNLIDPQGVTLDTIEYSPPDTNLKGLTLLPNGIAVGFFGKTICFSEPYLPYAWPVGYRQTTEHKIVGIAVVGNSVIVATKGNPYIFTGVSSDAMTGLKLEDKQSCVSKQSIVDMGEYVIFASPDGLVAANSSGIKVITDGIIRRDQWQVLYDPSTIVASYFEDKYIGFYNNSAGFIFDPRTKTLVNLDFYAQACFNDIKQDKLFLAVNNALVIWDENTTNKVMRWKKRFELNGKTIPSAIRIESDDLTKITFKLWIDGQEKINTIVPSETFRLPTGRGEQFEIEVSGTSNVRRIILADSMRSL